MVKLRLKRLGRKKRPYYRIVAIDATSPRDGQALSEVGMYDPLLAKVEVDEEETLRWLNAGASMTGTVRALLKNQGVLARWQGLEGEVSEGFLTGDKPKRIKKLAAAEAAATEPEAEQADAETPTEAPSVAAADDAAPAVDVSAPAAEAEARTETEASAAPAEPGAADTGGAADEPSVPADESSAKE